MIIKKSIFNNRNRLQLYIGILLLIAGGLYTTQQFSEYNYSKKESKIIVVALEENEQETENNGYNFDFDIPSIEISYISSTISYQFSLLSNFSTIKAPPTFYKIPLFIKICNFRL